MSDRKLDCWLIRIKDFVLIGGAVWALVIWGLGFINLPGRVAKTEAEIITLETKTVASEKANELFHIGIGKDIDYIKLGIFELKQSIGIKQR